MNLRRMPFRHNLLVLIISLLFIQEISYAQILDDDAPVGAFDLSACIQYAYDNLESLQLDQLDVERRRLEVKEQISVAYPQISADAGFNYNYQIQRSFIPAIIFDPTADPNEQVAVQFQPQFTSNIAVTLNQILFDPALNLGIQAAKEAVTLTEKQTKLNKINVAENVAKAFYAVLVSESRLELIDLNLYRLDTILNSTKALYENGFAEKIDVDRTQVAYNNLQVDKQNTQDLIEMSKKVLKFQMGMPIEQEIGLVGDLKEVEMDSSTYETLLLSLESEGYQKRAEYDLLLKQRELLDLNYRRFKRGLFYPRLNAQISYGANSGGNELGDVVFNVFPSDRWFSYGIIGINMSIPLFDGWRTRNTIAKSVIDLDKNTLELQSFERTYNFQVNQALTNIKTSIQNLQVQKNNMDLAKEVSRVSQIKFENGLGSTLEIIDAEASYKEAETNYYNSLYNAIIAQIDLRKALGILIED